MDDKVTPYETPAYNNPGEQRARETSFRPASDCESWRVKVLTFGLIALVAAGGISLYEDHGISTDEEFETMLVVWNLDLIGSEQNWRDIRKDGEYYGFFFNFISVMPYVAGHWIQGGSGTIQDVVRDGINRPQIYQSKHLFTFLFSLLAYLGVALFAKELLGYRWAALAVSFLALIPRFWGHSFFNPKDIPFAAALTIASYIGARITAHLIKRCQVGISLRLVITLAGSLGVMAGALTAIRVGGLILMVMAVIATAVLLIPLRPRLTSSTAAALLTGCLTMVAVWFAVTIALTPAAWQEPVTWFRETVSYLGGGVSSAHGWGPSGKVNVTFGANWRVERAWYYLPVWLGITTPLATIALAVGGWWLLVRRYSSLSTRGWSVLLWLNLQAFLLPLIAIATDAFFYNGVRHLLFLMPPLAVFAAVGVQGLYRVIKRRLWRTTFAVVLILTYGSLAYEMFKLHPYEYTWFNSLARKAHQSKEFETDYWGLSARAGMEWISAQEVSPKRVVYHAPGPSVRPFAGPEVQLIRFKLPIAEPERPFYYLAYPRNQTGGSPHPHSRFSECATVFRVERPLGSETMLLTVVKRCDR